MDQVVRENHRADLTCIVMLVQAASPAMTRSLGEGEVLCAVSGGIFDCISIPPHDIDVLKSSPRAVEFALALAFLHDRNLVRHKRGKLAINVPVQNFDNDSSLAIRKMHGNAHNLSH
jgi:hypothetical protein